jgi:hypothetical protein
MCTFWNSQRTETADFSTRRAATPSLFKQPCRLRNQTKTARGVARNHGNKHVTATAWSRIFRWLLVAVRCVSLRHNFLALSVLYSCTNISKLVTAALNWSARRNWDLKVKVVTVLLLKIHVLGNMTSGRIINNFFCVALTSQKQPPQILPQL